MKMDEREFIAFCDELESVAVSKGIDSDLIQNVIAEAINNRENKLREVPQVQRVEKADMPQILYGIPSFFKKKDNKVDVPQCIYGCPEDFENDNNRL